MPPQTENTMPHCPPALSKPVSKFAVAFLTRDEKMSVMLVTKARDQYHYSVHVEFLDRGVTVFVLQFPNLSKPEAAVGRMLT